MSTSPRRPRLLAIALIALCLAAPAQGAEPVLEATVLLSRFPEGTVPGHETAGRIAALGPGVDEWQTDDPVVAYGQVVCGSCPACGVSSSFP